LLAQRIDAASLKLEGEPFSVAASVGHVTPSAGAHFAVSADGATLVYQEQQLLRSQLAWYDRSGDRLGTLGPEGEYSQPRISPDGKRVALVSPDKDSGNRDIWLMDVGNGALTRLTSHPANDWFAVWSPDSARIAFSSDRTAPAGIYTKSAIGEGDEELVWQPRVSGAAAILDWSTDGRFLVYHEPGASANDVLWALPLFGPRKPFLLVQPEFAYGTARISPDGKRLAYPSTESGRNEVYVKPFGKPGKQRISPAGGDLPVWRKDGRELFYIAADGLVMAVQVKGGEIFEAAAPRALFRACSASQSLRGGEEFYDIASDGKRFLMSCLTGEGKPSALIVELHWTAALNKSQR
jgi:dipeptidyl aminopeptidase/acylaminoacyl peptidase